MKTEVRFNSEWLGALGSEGFIRLAATYNVARMLERRDFRQRYEAGPADLASTSSSTRSPRPTTRSP